MNNFIRIEFHFSFTMDLTDNEWFLKNTGKSAENYMAMSDHMKKAYFDNAFLTTVQYVLSNVFEEKETKFFADIEIKECKLPKIDDLKTDLDLIVGIEYDPADSKEVLAFFNSNKENDDDDLSDKAKSEEIRNWAKWVLYYAFHFTLRVYDSVYRVKPIT